MYIGTVLIYFSLVVSILSLASFLINTKKYQSAIVTGERLFYLSGASITIQVVLLFVAFISDRFDFDYVYSYSSIDLPTIYKIGAFWAGQEGTFLLWIFLLSIFGYFTIRAKDEYENILLPVIIITQIFLLVVLSIYNPFKYVWDASPGHFKPGLIPIDGTGLNPLLINPWMMIHPPVLFLGYASATIHFAYAIAALIMKDYNTWAKRAYKWVVFCMTTLGIGIFLGGYWAYVVLGWGGYWGWDPVENSSLIPWLVIVALMHGLIIQRRKGALVKTNFFLAIISFVLIFYGTFLTRSGVLSDFSVHSFSDLGLSGYLIFFILFFLVTGAVLFILRFKDIKSEHLSNKIVASDNLINYGILTLSFYALFILVGTSMPILSKLFMTNASSVTVKFYNSVSMPLGILILIFIVLASLYQFQKQMNKTNIIVISSSSVILGILFNQSYEVNAFVYIFAILSIYLIIQGIMDIAKFKTNSVLASRLAHLGIGFLVIGIITSNVHSYSIQKMLIQDEEKSIDNISLTFKGLQRSIKSSLQFVFKDGAEEQDVEMLYYINNKTNSLYREPFISYGILRDIYVSPVDYKSGEESQGIVTLVEGAEKEAYGVKIKFTGFEIDKNKMMSGTPVVFAKLEIKRNNRVYRLSPGVMIMSQKIKENMDVMLPGTARKISLRSLDIRHKTINLYIEPGKDDPVVPDSAIIEVSFKRLIWLVWLGTIFISIGGFVALRKYLLLSRKQ